MFISTMLMVGLILVLLIIAYAQGKHVQGLKAGMIMTIENMPLLILALMLTGLMQVVLPSDEFSRYIGSSSGIKAMLVAAFAGALFPGGPYVIFPIAAGLLRAGAGVGVIVSFVTGWSLWSLSRLPFEIGFLGWRIALIRVLTVLIFPVAAGMFSELISKVIK